MRVFVAGGSGVIGRRLVPQLVARGHQVIATTTRESKLVLLEQLGAEGIVMDGLNAASVGEAVAAARPDAIVHQMTGLSEAHAGKPNLRRADRFFAATNRLRSEGVDHLLAAAEATGVAYVVAQGHASMNGIRDGGWVKTEEDPLEVVEGTKAINHLEDVVVRAGGAVLRYGGFYGPGANDDQVKLVGKFHPVGVRRSRDAAWHVCASGNRGGRVYPLLARSPILDQLGPATVAMVAQCVNRRTGERTVETDPRRPPTRLKPIEPAAHEGGNR